MEKTFVKCCWCARLLRMDALPAHGYLATYHGSREHTEMNVMRADSASQRARQGWHGRRRCSLVRCTVLMLSAERPKGERGATLAAASAPRFVSKLRQEPKGVNHGPFDQRPEWPAGSRTVALRRQHTHCRRSRGTSLATVQERRQGVCVLCVCRPQGQSPDLTCTRGAALAECALIARADLSGLALDIA